MAVELGDKWREKLATFDEKPFAAASIGKAQQCFYNKFWKHNYSNQIDYLFPGQVHHGTLLNGQPVAIKIQYPGVAQGIESDIENLVGVMKVWVSLDQEKIPTSINEKWLTSKFVISGMEYIPRRAFYWQFSGNSQERVVLGGWLCEGSWMYKEV